MSEPKCVLGAKLPPIWANQVLFHQMQLQLLEKKAHDAATQKLLRMNDAATKPLKRFYTNILIQYRGNDVSMITSSNAAESTTYIQVTLLAQNEIRVAPCITRGFANRKHTKTTEIFTNHRSLSCETEAVYAGALEGSTTARCRRAVNVQLGTAS